MQMQEYNFGCGFCPKHFSNPNSLENHLKTIHKSKRSSNYPKIKSEVVTTNDQENSMLVNKWLSNQKFASDQEALDQKTLSCKYCFKKFSSEFNAKRHEINKSSNSIRGT